MEEGKEEFSKYPKIFLIGKEENKDIFSVPEDIIDVEEKIDGANFRFMITKEGRIIFGSHNGCLGYDDMEIGGNWKRCIEFVKTQLRGSEMLKPLTEYGGLIFYGECCVKHTINYDWGKIPSYLGFDIYRIYNGDFMNNIEKRMLFAELNLPIVPYIKNIKAGEIKELTDNDVPKSQYYEGPSEGIVLKNYKRQIMGKYVREQFREENKNVFGKSKKECNDDSERLVATYCTQARMDKIIFKLVDNGEKLDMPLMHKLPEAVLEDIYTENWREICFSQWSVNFRNIKKQISHRCLEALKQVIVNSALNK
jgi:hypothetical protein